MSGLRVPPHIEQSATTKSLVSSSVTSASGATSIAPRPEIIFFDEPTTGLDPIRADVINDLIVSLVNDLGVTALTITHDMASARKIAHRVAMLYKGRIVWHGPRDRLYDSGNPYVDQFVQGRADGPIS